MSHKIFTYFRLTIPATAFIALLAFPFSGEVSADTSTQLPSILSKKIELCTIRYSEKVQKVGVRCSDRVSIFASSNDKVLSLLFISKSSKSSDNPKETVQFYRGYLTPPNDLAGFKDTLGLMEQCIKIETCFSEHESEEKSAPIFSIKQSVRSWDVTLAGFGNLAPMDDKHLSLFMTDNKIIGVFSDELDIGITKYHNFFTINK